MSLRDYRRKRRFEHADGTPEPRGAAAAGPARRPVFVVQLHHARSRHYDFRLEAGGVLKSWAVPKGPSLRVGERRLAVQVEDHPLAYAAFEGDIPPGHYGAGHVELFDRGSWACEGDPLPALAAGRLDFVLHGDRLGGGWTLVRTALRGRQPQWLLIKRDDAAAADLEADDLLEAGRAAAGTTKRPPPRPPPGKPPRAAAEVRITHPERVVYPASGITKGQVADYYRAIAPWLLPEVVRRPLSLLRCPDGVAGECFFQKHGGERFGPHVRTLPLAQKSGVEDYLYIEDAAGLLELVQMNVLELHPWGASVDDPEHPDRLVFDLDPGEGVDWDAVKAAAREIRARLRRAGLESFVRLSGGKGLHVVAPIAPGPGWDAARGFCEAFARALAAAAPQRYTATMSKRRRRGVIFVDWLRNGRGNTSVCNWSLRARERASVAVPLRWEELGRIASPQAFPPRKALARARRLKSDPWDGIAKLVQTLPGFL